MNEKQSDRVSSDLVTSLFVFVDEAYSYEMPALAPYASIESLRVIYDDWKDKATQNEKNGFGYVRRDLTSDLQVMEINLDHLERCLLQHAYEHGVDDAVSVDKINTVLDDYSWRVVSLSPASEKASKVFKDMLFHSWKESAQHNEAGFSFRKMIMATRQLYGIISLIKSKSMSYDSKPELDSRHDYSMKDNESTDSHSKEIKSNNPQT